MPNRRTFDGALEGPVTVGVDGSAYADVAAVWATHEALRRGTAVRLVAVADAAGGSGEPGRLDSGEAYERLARTEASLTDSFPALKVESEVAVGDPFQELELASRSTEILVVGARGSGGFAQLALGSVSLRLAAAAGCPLVIVPAGHAAAHPGTTVAGVTREGSARVLRFALGQADRAHSGLRVVHAWNPNRPDADVDIAARHTAEYAMHWLKTAHAEASGADLEISVLRGEPSEVLAAQSTRANLLVLGAHRRLTPPSGGVGSVLHEVLLHARCPVALVPIS
ncbi:MAG TPA: universal stress protein [Actinospica sp.]|nr:universal stress protein [Actinospica sp.]